MTISSPFGQPLLTVQARPSATDSIRPVVINLAYFASMDFVQHSFDGQVKVYLKMTNGDLYRVEGSEAEALATQFNPAYSVEKRLVDLRSQIEYHKYRYHTLNDPNISDAHYDALVRELRALEGTTTTTKRTDNV